MCFQKSAEAVSGILVTIESLKLSRNEFQADGPATKVFEVLNRVVQKKTHRTISQWREITLETVQ